MEQMLRAARIFDGTRFHEGAAVSLTAGGRIAALHAAGTALPRDLPVTDLGDAILAPGLVDLQVNGGGGEMIGPDTDAAQIARICAAHIRLGATAILPTLISDRTEVTAQVIRAGIDAGHAGVPGFAGLHLEGPHLDPARKGAHDANHLRPMQAADLHLLCEAARALPALKVTLAPEMVSMGQITALTEAGVLVSLGHSGCTADTAQAAHAAGARCVTHLFNAMGGLMNRAPGLVGAALTTRLAAGIIADGVHVAPECLLVALAMKAEPDLYLVSDAMAVAGSSAAHFRLNGRRILREGGRLTLEDGTLAGADITLPQSIAHLIRLGVAPERAVAMASRVPADIIAAQDRGRITQGARGDFVVLSPDFTLQHSYVAGVRQRDDATQKG